MSVYQTERYGNSAYTITNLTAGASYIVRLHFAELYWGTAGGRVFNVFINGSEVLTNFDIVATVGSNYKALVEQFTVPANGSGNIVIGYSNVIDNAKASGIEILSAQTVPIITSQPSDQSVVGGATATFTATATGYPSPTYQWLRNGSLISGQTASSLVISNANANNVGSYLVIVSNSVGMVASRSVGLTVANTPPTLAPVSNQSVNVGVTLNITNIATDPDVPAQTLNFSLLASPSGAVVDANSGVFTWVPLPAQANTTNIIKVVVMDSGSPILSVTNNFNIVVPPNVAVFSGLTASQSVNYGTADLILSGTISATGPAYPAIGETVAVTINGNTQTTTINDSTGDFSIIYNPAVIPASGTAYTITYLYGGNGLLSSASNTSTALTVNKAALTITADNTNKIYGQTVVFAGTEFVTSGLTNGDSVTSVTLTSAGATNTATPGGYAVVTSAAVGSGLGNYNITYNNGTLAVNPAPLLVSADNNSRAYGATNPTLTVSYSGFVNGEVLATSDVGGAPSLTTAADTNSPVGSYNIMAELGTLTSTNYSFTFSNGTLTVTTAPLGITANNDSKTYNGMGYAGGNGVTYIGFVNGESSSALSGILSYGGTSQNATNAGSYSIVPSGLTSTNYAINYTNGTLTINPASISITADNDSKVYGQTKSYGAGSTAFTSVGLQNGETIGTVTITTSGGTAANAPVGGYDLVPSAATGGTFNTTNYNLAYHNGTLTVTAAPQPVGQTVSVSGSTVTATFAGVAGVTYVTQSATDLTGAWTDISTNTPGMGGTWTITDSATRGQTFYRAVIP
jgi:hypothetical protein